MGRHTKYLYKQEKGWRAQKIFSCRIAASILLSNNTISYCREKDIFTEYAVPLAGFCFKQSNFNSSYHWCTKWIIEQNSTQSEGNGP